jgi:threonine aldolase
MINLISDTVTQPTPAMLKAMMNAQVGDDVFGTDPTVNQLEAMAAQLFGHEAALFCPSGTMTNQIAIKVHTQPMDEVICDELSHIYKSENGGYAYNSGVAIQLIRGGGKITRHDIEPLIKPNFDWLPRTKLVVLENTVNHAGGIFYRLSEILPIQQLCKERGLILHLDGARLFNALVETQESPRDWGAAFHSISICLSKGLGAPVGSLLIGDKATIQQARRIRKAMGGGMRQAGFLAAAGIFALQNNIERLKTDNDHAKKIAAVVQKLPFVENIRPVQTNILIFDIKKSFATGEQFIEMLAQHNIQAVLFGPQTVRFVTHLNVSSKMIAEVCSVLKKLR